MLDKNAVRSTSHPTRLEIAVVLAPGLVRLAFDFYLRVLDARPFFWSTIAVLVAAVEWLRRKNHHPITFWFWPLGALTLQGGWWLLQSATEDILMVVSHHPSATVHPFLWPLAVFGVAASGLIVWHVLRTQPVRVWLILAGLALAVLGLTLCTNTEQWLASCPGYALRHANLSCVMRQYFGEFGYGWFTLLVLWVPTVVALASQARHGVAASLWLTASVVLWRDVLYLPFQLYGGVWLEAIWRWRWAHCPVSPSVLERLLHLVAPWTLHVPICDVCNTLDAGVESTSHLVVLVFGLLLPAGLLFLRSEKVRTRWTFWGSLAGMLAVCYLGVRMLILGREVLQTTPVDFVIVGLSGLLLWLPFAAFAAAAGPNDVAVRSRQDPGD